MGSINVIIKEPGRVPRHVNISNTLRNLQNTVGGYIEVVHSLDHPDMIAIVDEEGICKRKSYACTFEGHQLYGTVIFAGVDGEEISHVPMSWKNFKNEYIRFWEACV